MLLQAALNGPFGKETHAALPISAAELCADAAACVAAGAGAIHMHPRDRDGHETLEPAVVDGVAAAVRSACGAPVGVSTGAWIEPDPERRLELISRWREPDYASVNLSEDGSARVMETLLLAGVGIEAGVWSVDDVGRLASSGLCDRVTRVLVEPVELAAEGAVAAVDAIHAALDDASLTAPRLQHGDGEATWILIDDAIRRGCNTRVGLEDTARDRDGELSAGNAALVRSVFSGEGRRVRRDR